MIRLTDRLFSKDIGTIGKRFRKTFSDRVGAEVFTVRADGLNRAFYRFSGFSVKPDLCVLYRMQNNYWIPFLIGERPSYLQLD